MIRVAGLPVRSRNSRRRRGDEATSGRARSLTRTRCHCRGMVSSPPARVPLSGPGPSTIMVMMDDAAGRPAGGDWQDPRPGRQPKRGSPSARGARGHRRHQARPGCSAITAMMGRPWTGPRRGHGSPRRTEGRVLAEPRFNKARRGRDPAALGPAVVHAHAASAAAEPRARGTEGPVLAPTPGHCGTRRGPAGALCQASKIHWARLC
jgi:hypothetical protein